MEWKEPMWPLSEAPGVRAPLRSSREAHLERNSEFAAEALIFCLHTQLEIPAYLPLPCSKRAHILAAYPSAARLIDDRFPHLSFTLGLDDLYGRIATTCFSSHDMAQPCSR